MFLNQFATYNLIYLRTQCCIAFKHSSVSVVVVVDVVAGAAAAAAAAPVVVVVVV